MRNNTATAIASALIKCVEAQDRLPNKRKEERNTTPYSDGWQDALFEMQTVLTEFLPLEQKQIVDSCLFGMNKKGGKLEDAKAYFEHYFQPTPNV
jgi:hypothetical protein